MGTICLTVRKAKDIRSLAKESFWRQNEIFHRDLQVPALNKETGRRGANFLNVTFVLLTPITIV